ncbi:Protein DETOXIFICATION 24 [Camellia lanceoleosa]|uniref:Protein DETOXIFICATION 24 n=1 Tax=Camellia lanceoleosa TaxID=1840588 RepID=A0ACC0I6D1_9ERIC|nr:Protein DETOXIFICATION 24 [Camellia lanceoleosa]
MQRLPFLPSRFALISALGNLCCAFAFSALHANELGRGDARAAKFSIKVILCTSVLLGLIFFALCLIFGHDIAYLFTSNEEVAKNRFHLSVILAFTMLLNSIQPGIWIGMTTRVVMQVIALAFMVWRTDWDDQVNKASERLGRWFLKPSEESDEVLSHS